MKEEHPRTVNSYNSIKHKLGILVHVVSIFHELNKFKYPIGQPATFIQIISWIAKSRSPNTLNSHTKSYTYI